MSQATALNPACAQALFGALLLHSIRLPLMVISTPGWDPWVGDVDEGPVPANMLSGTEAVDPHLCQHMGTACSCDLRAKELHLGIYSKAWLLWAALRMAPRGRWGGALAEQRHPAGT